MDMLDLDAGWGTGRLEKQPRPGRAGRQPCLKLLLLQPHQVWSKPVGRPAARRGPPGQTPCSSLRKDQETRLVGVAPTCPCAGAPGRGHMICRYAEDGALTTAAFLGFGSPFASIRVSSRSHRAPSTAPVWTPAGRPAADRACTLTLGRLVPSTGLLFSTGPATPPPSSPGRRLCPQLPLLLLRAQAREFPRGPAARGLCIFTTEGTGSIPGEGTEIPQAAQCGQKK